MKNSLKSKSENSHFFTNKTKYMNITKKLFQYIISGKIFLAWNIEKNHRILAETKKRVLLHRNWEERVFKSKIFSGCSAARLAHLLWEQGVPGSNPGTPTDKESSKELSLFFALWPTIPTYLHTSIDNDRTILSIFFSCLVFQFN